MNPFDIIRRYYEVDSPLYQVLVKHSTDVTNKALKIAHNHPELGINIQFVKEAGMLHDIGIFKTDAPSIHCIGIEPYIKHGIIGSDIMTKEGYPQHALVCERHTGAGLTLAEIKVKDLPLPHRDMIPVSIEEKLICFSDCFFSKTHLGQEKSVKDVREKLSKFGSRSVDQFDEWCSIFL